VISNETTRNAETKKKLKKGRENNHQKKAVKGKAIPVQASTRPEGSRRLRLPDFKTIGT
jgi:hypothetical protein